MLPKPVYAILLFANGAISTIGYCWEPSPAFPVPELDACQFESAGLAKKFDDLISNALKTSSPEYSWEQSSFAIQITSGTETLWSSFYTAPELGNYSDGNPTSVTGDTAFRLASCSKLFAVYALLLEKNVGLEDPITKYLPELKEERPEYWGMPVDWDHITIRSLASQMSGLGRGLAGPDLAFAEGLVNGVPWDPVSRGLQMIASNDTFLSPCFNGGPIQKSCTKAQLITMAQHLHPVFSPNDRPTYSNVGFSLLGLALEKATGLSYSSILQNTVLDPLNMTSTTLSKSNDSQGILPVGETHWYLNFDADNPTNGVYSTANDISKFLRSILASSLLPKNTTNAWMKPHSWTSSRTNSAYGMPWEILRTTKVTPDGHPVDIISKGGALAGYYSTIALLPEYGVGFTILTATPDRSAEFYLREIITAELIRSLDALVRNIALERYAGFYGYRHGWEGTPDGPSDYLDARHSITIDVDNKGPGLLLKSWNLESKNFLSTYGGLKWMPKDGNAWEARLIPTNLGSPYGDDAGFTSEAWRLTAIPKNKTDGLVFNDFCFTDVDALKYGGVSLEEFVFSRKIGEMEVDTVVLSGPRIWLEKGNLTGTSGTGARAPKWASNMVNEMH